jgi:hypothetical protein
MHTSFIQFDFKWRKEVVRFLHLIGSDDAHRRSERPPEQQKCDTTNSLHIKYLYLTCQPSYRMTEIARQVGFLPAVSTKKLWTGCERRRRIERSIPSACPSSELQQFKFRSEQTFNFGKRPARRATTANTLTNRSRSNREQF